MRLSKIGALLLVLVFAFSVQLGEAAPRKVIEVSAVSAGLEDLGGNMLKFNFAGRITTNGPTTVKYRWVRSDGATGPVTELVFDSAGSKYVETYWQLGKREQELHLWEAIEILAPNVLRSNEVNITVPALAEVTEVRAGSTGSEDLGGNMLKFNFAGRITTNGPTTVKYRWVRSDGATGPVTELVFESAGSKYVETYWQLGKRDQELHLWEAIEIFAPSVLRSNEANITVPAISL